MKRKRFFFRACLQVILILTLLMPPGATQPAHAQSTQPTELAYIDASGTVRLTSLDGQTKTQVSKGGKHMGLAWSPDGARLFSLRPGSGSIVEFDLASGQEREIVPAGLSYSSGFSLDVSPDGTRLVLIAKSNETFTPAGSQKGLPKSSCALLVTLSDASMEKLACIDYTAGGMMGDLTAAAFTPDGQAIAVSVFASGYSLMLYPLNGGEAEMGNGGGEWMHYTPDGKAMLVIGAPGFIPVMDLAGRAEWGIFHYSLDTQEYQVLLSGDEYLSSPDLSADGRYLVYVTGGPADGPGTVRVLDLQTKQTATIDRGAASAWRRARVPTISPVLPADFDQVLVKKQQSIVFLKKPNFAVINMPSISGAGFDESAAEALLAETQSQMATDTLIPQAASGFLRLQLQEEVLAAAYNDSLKMHDLTLDASMLFMDILSYITLAAKKITKPLGKVGEKLLDKIQEKLSDALNEWIQGLKGVSPGIKTAITILLDQMEGQIGLEGNIQASIRTGGVVVLANRFTRDHQSLIDQSVINATRPETFGGSDDTLVREEITAKVAAYQEKNQENYSKVSQAAEILDDYMTAWTPIFVTGPIGKVTIAINALVVASADANLLTVYAGKSTQYTNTLLQETQTTLFPNAGGAYLRPDPNAQAPLVLTGYQPARDAEDAVNGLEQSAVAFEDLLKQVSATLQGGKTDQIEALLPPLNAAETEFSMQVKRQQPMDYSTDISSRAIAYDLSVVNYYLTLAASLGNPQDAALRSAETDQAAKLIAELHRYQQAVSPAASPAQRPAQAPGARILAVSLAENAAPGQEIELRVDLSNPSAAVLDGAYLRVRLGSQVIFTGEPFTVLPHESRTVLSRLTFPNPAEVFSVEVMQVEMILDQRLVIQTIGAPEEPPVTAPIAETKESSPVTLVFGLLLALFGSGAILVFLLRRQKSEKP